MSKKTEQTKLKTLNDEQLALYEQIQERTKNIAQLEKPKVVKTEGGTKVEVHQKSIDGLSTEEHRLQMISTMGTKSLEAANLLMKQLTSVVFDEEEPSSQIINAMLEMVHNIAPQDDLEAMLVCQIVTTHMLSMDTAMTAQFLKLSEHPKLKASSQEMTIKLMRSFTNQFNALSKHRNGGKQKMTVEHVHVNEGGQAIIGDVSKG